MITCSRDTCHVALWVVEQGARWVGFTKDRKATSQGGLFVNKLPMDLGQYHRRRSGRG